ncbi:hypothetical protein ACN3E9_11315 [Vibrio pectenicida]|uniref:hypothetical protein n=1 Tax=Vibrio pectenicida TaxID=62763 RepID=UPI003B99A457
MRNRATELRSAQNIPRVGVFQQLGVAGIGRFLLIDIKATRGWVCTARAKIKIIAPRTYPISPAPLRRERLVLRVQPSLT